MIGESCYSEKPFLYFTLRTNFFQFKRVFHYLDAILSYADLNKLRVFIKVYKNIMSKYSCNNLVYKIQESLRILC